MHAAPILSFDRVYCKHFTKISRSVNRARTPFHLNRLGTNMYILLSRPRHDDHSHMGVYRTQPETTHYLSSVQLETRRGNGILMVVTATEHVVLSARHYPLN